MTQTTSSRGWIRTVATVWGGELFSVLTSSVLQMGLIWHITTTTKSALAVTLASLVGFLPTAFFGPFAGVIVDRFRIPVVMISADMSIAFISLSLTVWSLFTGDIPIGLVMAVLCLRSFGQSIHTPAFNSLTPLIAPKDMLDKLAGISQVVQSSGYLVGTAVAAVMYPLWGLQSMILLDVLGATVASACVLLSRVKDTRERSKTKHESVMHAVKAVTSEAFAGYQILRKDESLFAVLIGGFIFTLAFSPLSALFPLITIDYFDAGTTGAAIVEVVWSAGMLVGGAIIGATGGLKKKAHSIVLSCIIFGSTIFFSGLLPRNGFVIFVILNVIMGLSEPLYQAPVTALMQERVAPEYMGRAFALFNALQSWALPLGLAVSAFFVDGVSVPIFFVICGIAILLLAVVLLLLPQVRRIDAS